MSFQSFVTDRLAELTAKFNAIATNAKKIDELAVQNNLDPASKIHVSRGGISESLSVQKIIDAVSSGSYDKLLAIGEITLVDNLATIPANAQWKIADVNYGNIAAIEIPIPYCVTGLSRKDILVANTLNEIILVQGTETAGSIVIAPNIPINTVFITEMDVTDSTVGTPITPVIGSDYILKQESYDFLVSYYDAVIEQVDLNDHRASLNFMGANTDVKSIALSGEFMRNGKIFTFKNHNATPLTIWHNSGTGNVKLLFPNEENFVLQPNEVIQFSLNYYDTSIPRLEYIGIISSGGGVGLPIAITDVTGLTEELADRYTKSEVDAKVSSVYKFKGNVANYAALPATGLTIGDVYNLLDTGANYAWTGTVWDKLGDTVDISGKENTSNKTDVITGNEASSSLYSSIKGIVDWITDTKIRSILGISTLSGSNTGDETTATLKTKIFEELAYACSDETSNLTVGNLISFRVPFAMTLSEVRISLNDAPTVSSVVVDVKESGTSIFSTLLSIDASELTSVTAAVPAVISDVNLADDALLTVSTTQIGSGNTGKGLKIVFKGKRA